MKKVITSKNDEHQYESCNKIWTKSKDYNRNHITYCEPAVMTS